jgi:CBS-domain-containing membrane protein
MNKRKDTELRREDFVNALRDMDTFMDISVDDLMDLNSRAEKYARLRATGSILVRQIMTSPVETVQGDTPLAEAAHLMVSRRISGLPVVDADQRLVGLVTEADFLRAMGLPGHHPTHSLWQTLESLFQHQEQIREPEGVAADLMVSEVIGIHPEQNLQDVLEVMKKYRIKRVVVTDEERRVVGMVTRSDLVRVFFDRIRKPAGAAD